MAPKVRKLINVIWGLLLLLVVVDHVTSFSYRLWLRKVVHADVSLYIEITGMVFTMGVPFFYSLYKRRENQLEMQAVKAGGGAAELEAARGRNDRRCILYYSLMAAFVILLVFVQSSIINASKAETAGLEEQIVAMRKSLKVSNDQIREMNARLAKLESIVREIAVQDKRTRAVLREIEEIRVITQSIDRMMAETMSRVQARPTAAQATEDFDEIAERVRVIEERLERLEETVEGPLAESSTALREDVNAILKLVRAIDRAVKEGRSSGGRPVPSRPRSAALSAAELEKLREWVGRYVEDFRATSGALGDPDRIDKAALRKRFEEFLQRQGSALAKFKADVGNGRVLIEKALDRCARGENLGLPDCERDLRWLLLLLEL